MFIIILVIKITTKISGHSKHITPSYFFNTFGYIERNNQLNHVVNSLKIRFFDKNFPGN